MYAPKLYASKRKHTLLAMHNKYTFGYNTSNVNVLFASLHIHVSNFSGLNNWR